MSLVIAIKDKDRIILGADKQGSQGNRKDHSATKVWEVKGYDNCVMGGVGYARANQIIQYCQGLLDKNSFDDKDGIDEEFVVSLLAPTIQKTLELYGVSLEGSDSETGVTIKGMTNTFIFAYKDRAFVINPDLCVTEITDYAAIGSGAETARGSLYSSKDKDPFQRIVEAIEAASLETMFVDDSVEICLTKEYPEDEKMYNDATGLTELIEAMEKAEKEAKKQSRKEAKKKKKEKDTQVAEDIEIPTI